MPLRYLIVRVNLLLGFVLLLATAGSASAHAELVRSEPAAGARLTAAPQQVTIEFSQLLDAAKSTITVVDAAGATVSQGNAEVLTNNNKALRVALKPNLGPGEYTVQWSNLSSEDGEEESSTFTFTVGGASAPGTTPATSGNQDAPPAQLPATGQPLPTAYSIMLSVIALVLIALGVALRSAQRLVPVRRSEGDA